MTTRTKKRTNTKSTKPEATSCEGPTPSPTGAVRYDSIPGHLNTLAILGCCFREVLEALPDMGPASLVVTDDAVVDATQRLIEVNRDLSGVLDVLLERLLCERVREDVADSLDAQFGPREDWA